MHVDEVLCHGKNGGTTWETPHRGCLMRKVVSNAVTAGGRFDFFWTLRSNVRKFLLKFVDIALMEKPKFEDCLVLCR